MRIRVERTIDRKLKVPYIIRLETSCVTAVTNMVLPDPNSDFACGELCRVSLSVGSVPAIAYFKDASRVNIVIGLTQDIPGKIRKIMEGHVPANPAGIISRLLRPTRTSLGRADS